MRHLTGVHFFQARRDAFALVQLAEDGIHASGCSWCTAKVGWWGRRSHGNIASKRRRGRRWSLRSWWSRRRTRGSGVAVSCHVDSLSIKEGDEIVVRCGWSHRLLLGCIAHLWIPRETSGVMLHDVFFQDVQHFDERATPLDVSAIPARV